MWTDHAGIAQAPRTERYPSDITEAEWALIAPMIPPPRRGGRPRDTDMREVFNAVRYVLRTGCHPQDAPAVSLHRQNFRRWRLCQPQAQC
jgi:transposase